MQSSILDHSYLLSKSQLDFYKENAYIKLKEVLDPATLANYNRVISKKVNELNQQKLPLKQRDTYGKAFLQLFNLWNYYTLLSLIRRYCCQNRRFKCIEGCRSHHFLGDSGHGTYRACGLFIQCKYRLRQIDSFIVI